MRITRYLALLLGLTAIHASAADATTETIAGTRMRVDWPRLISGNNIELHNLAADPAHRQPLERLFAALKQWSADTQDTSTPLPLKP